MKDPSPPPTSYGLQISTEIEGRLARCRTPIRAAIRLRLQEIVAAAEKGGRSAKVKPAKEPPLRFYVYEGYRVLYQIDATARRVVVLDLGAAKA